KAIRRQRQMRIRDTTFTSLSAGSLSLIIRQEKNLYNILRELRNDADAAFNRIVDTVMLRMRRSDDSLYREYNQNEGFQGNFRNLLRQIIDDQDYREVVDNFPTES
ncbi:MAG: hypothetical protein K2K45_07065, partial [Muribaculaceae bacterium]|nr:hypothetical protein [Muribaculaceae bacterium]